MVLTNLFFSPPPTLAKLVDFVAYANYCNHNFVSLGLFPVVNFDNHSGCFLVLQEIMEDPYIAADGFTYEAEAIRGWLNSGHDTSPMTNLKLDHTDLVPNYALHNAIREWQQQ